MGIGSNVICGVQSPLSAAADVAVDNAERLAGLCMVKAIDPDAVVFFCNHPYQIDLRSGDVASGSPEQALVPLLGQKLLEYYGFTLMANHPILDTSSHAPDAQAAAEKMMYLLMAGLAGCKGIGGVGGLKETLCYEQAVIDDEIAGYVKRILRGVAVDEDALQTDAIIERGPGGFFLDTEHTLRTMGEYYHDPVIFCRKRLSEYLEGDGTTALERAHERVRQILGRDPVKHVSPDQELAMDEVIERARQELAPGWRPRWDQGPGPGSRGPGR